jgi:AcrR family transcriptional regulator
MPRAIKPPLTKLDWIKAAFQALTRDGESALKAEVIARSLNTTKGSFYWHFKDIPAFRKEMLRLWQSEATAAIIEIVENSGRLGADKLRLLAKIVTTTNADNDYGGLPAEPAIRSWSLHDKMATRALKQVDAARIGYVQKLFAEANYSEEIARHRAEVFYSSFVGLQTLAPYQPIKVAERLTDVLNSLLD